MTEYQSWSARDQDEWERDFCLSAIALEQSSHKRDELRGAPLETLFRIAFGTDDAGVARTMLFKMMLAADREAADRAGAPRPRRRIG